MNELGISKTVTEVDFCSSQSIPFHRSITLMPHPSIHPPLSRDRDFEFGSNMRRGAAWQAPRVECVWTALREAGNKICTWLQGGMDVRKDGRGSSHRKNYRDHKSSESGGRKFPPLTLS